MRRHGGVARWERIVWPLLTAALLVGVWAWAVTATGTKVFPSPLDVIRGFRELATRSVLWRYIGDSLGRVAAGFGLATAIGVPLGLALGWYGEAGRVVNPLLQVLRPISPIAWIPVAIVIFGVGNRPAIFLIFLAAFFPIVVSAMNAVGNVPLVFRLAGQNFGLQGARLLARVILPAALPRLLIGLRIALGIAWVVVVAAEMIAVDSGLGYLVIDSRNAGKRYDLVVAAMLTIGIIGLMLDTGVRALARSKRVQWGVRH